MTADETSLSKQEIQWIIERRVTRLTDNKEVQIYPMGAERYLSSALNEAKIGHYNIKNDIEGKHVLVIPGYGNSSFIFALAGAESVTAYDKDPVTIAWMKAYKKYYHYREYDKHGHPYPSVGELLTALTYWYPPLIKLPEKKISNFLFWILQPNSLRRVYVHYLVFLIGQAVECKTKDNYELEKKITFHAGTVSEIDKKQHFDTAFVPYLLGVKNGIEQEKDIVLFMRQLLEIIPEGHVLVNPSRAIKEFYVMGKRYIETINHDGISEIPELQVYALEEDRYWFHSQGIAVFASRKTSV